MVDSADLHAWAHETIARHIRAASDALRAFYGKPRSAKCLHQARKCLARLRAALEDLGPAAGADEPDFYERIDELHRRAGKVRDADVLLERVREYRRKASDEERRQLALLCAVLRKRRKKARHKLERLVRRFPELSR